MCIVKEEITPVLFADGIIVHADNVPESTKRIFLDLIDELNKVSLYTINNQETIIFLCSSPLASGLCCLLPGVTVWTRLATAFWYWSHQGKHNTVKYYMEQCFTHIEKRQSKVSYVVGISPLNRRASLQQMRGSWRHVTLSCYSRRTFCPPRRRKL